MSKTTGATGGTGTANLSGKLLFKLGSCCSYVFCVMFCGPLFDLLFVFFVLYIFH